MHDRGQRLGDRTELDCIGIFTLFMRVSGWHGQTLFVRVHPNLMYRNFNVVVETQNLASLRLQRRWVLSFKTQPNLYLMFCEEQEIYSIVQNSSEQ